MSEEGYVPMLDGEPWVPPTGEELERAKKKGDVVTVHQSIIENKNLSDGAIIVWSYFKRAYQMVDTEYVEESQREIGEALGKSRKTVLRKVKELKEQGYLEMKRDGFGSFKYYLNIPEKQEP